MKYDLWGAIIGSTFAIGMILFFIIYTLCKYLKLKKKRKDFFWFNPEIIKEIKKKHNLKSDEEFVKYIENKYSITQSNSGGLNNISIKNK